ncbi:DNA/RNA non-specific endonuclease [Rummeliibacillus stabekisii]|uniref:DNA/RNA non-specific endonuclease n=1 Tax=Rummeliibacillus stabekisii TaxID=241244 RepID=UPI002040853B|nr:DNA/RNA non-specific endonuclease [Rummeliibacillus stabekisii]
MKILYEEAKWKSIASALEKVNEAHKYDNKYEHADDLFKDSKSEIADKDIDRAISFSPQTYQPEAKPIREKYKKLYDYAKGIGKIIDEKVDEPFYKSIDEYMQKMADMNVSAYTTANTINVQTGPFFNRHDKKEIKLTDLYEADTEYSDNLKAEYEAWKLQNPDVKASQEDYETAALNSGAFEYEGIRTGQEKKEFWFNLIATGVVVGLTIVCPPAGLVAGAAYTAIDVGGAITGEDLISGRKLSDNERLVRGAFAIVPGAGAAAGKALLKNMPALANVMKSAYKTVENAGGSALKSTLEHARNLGKAHGDQLKFTLKHPVLAAVTSKTGQQTVRQSAKFIDNALRPIEVRAVQTNAGNVVTGVERGLPSGKLPAKADEYLAIKQAEKDGVLAGKGTGKGNAVLNEEKTLVETGKHFTNGRKNKLKPNIRYKTGEYDYFYETDNLGRIEKFETDKLQLTVRDERLSHSKNTPGKVKGQDHAGHLAGDRFGGSPKIDNLVSQLSDVNLKQYKKIENEWAAALKETPPKEVTVDVEVIYSGKDMRPEKFSVKYTIDGEAFSETLIN